MRYAILLLLFSASAQAADPLLVARIVVCESSSPDVCGDDGVSCGIAQFRKETFYEFAKMAGLKHPRWMDFRQQVFLLDWGLTHGYANRWSCFRKLRRKLK